jgi:hypothetical protein
MSTKSLNKALAHLRLEAVGPGAEAVTRLIDKAATELKALEEAAKALVDAANTTGWAMPGAVEAFGVIRSIAKDAP